MRIEPHETAIVGAWIMKGGRMTGDSACERVHALTKTDLKFIAGHSNGWERLYVDPRDGRYWEHTYPQSGMHGGGPPALFQISAENASAKYKLPG